MAPILYKWITVFSCSFLSTWLTHEKKELFHPVFVSVTEIEHNANDKTLEISCKIFTDDFEKTLRKSYTGKIDLVDEKQKTAMGNLINGYIQKHLSVTTDGKKTSLQFLGFEQEEEGIISYFQASNITAVKNVAVLDNLLYEYSTQQMNIVHVIVNGNRKSTRLNNPDANASFIF
jgi:hypothetical protein